MEDASHPFEAEHVEPSHVTGSTVGALGHSVPMVAGERTQYSTEWIAFFLRLTLSNFMLLLLIHDSD